MRTCAAFALCLVACTRGCSTELGEHTFESLDGAVRVELVRDTAIANGPILMTQSQFVIRVHASKTFDESTECEKVDLAENASGDLVAFRCKDAPTWSLIRIGHADRHFLQCTTTLSGKTPDFGKVAPLADVAAAIVACAPEIGSAKRQNAGVVLGNLADELRAASGEAAVVRLLDETREAKTLREEWSKLALGLSPSGRADLEARLCSVLAAPAAPKNAYERAARLCSYDAPHAGDGALERARVLFSLPPADLAERRDAIEWWFLIAAHTHPRELGEAACTFANGSDLLAEDVALAIAVSKVPCGAIAARAACEENVECDEHICTQAELAPSLAKWLKQAAPLPAGVRSDPTRPPRTSSALLAAYAQGPLPKRVALVRARRAYTIDRTTAPDCHDPNSAELCTARDARGQQDVRAGSCALHIDDARRSITVRQVCEPDASSDACVP